MGDNMTTNATTPKGFRQIAQGCTRSGLLWVASPTTDLPQRGCVIHRPTMTEPFQGSIRRDDGGPRVARWRVQPWAVRRNPVGVGIRWLSALASLCLFAFLAANSAFAQEPQATRPPATPPMNPNPDIPARPTIIFPFDVNDPKGPLAAERVYLPHAKFIELWNAAHPESRVAPPAPQEGLVAEALVVVTPNKKADGADATAKVTARVTLFSFRKQQIVLPVPLRLASISDAKLDDSPASIVVRGEGDAARLHVVLDKPGLHVLDLTAEVPVNQQGPAGQLVIGVDPPASSDRGGEECVARRPVTDVRGKADRLAQGQAFAEQRDTERGGDDETHLRDRNQHTRLALR